MNELLEEGLIAQIFYRGPELNRVHRLTRMRFAREHQNWDENEWSRVLFTDELRFCLRSPDGRERVWRRAGERYAECTFSPRVSFQEGSVMIWAGISMESRTELYLIPRGCIHQRDTSRLCCSICTVGRKWFSSYAR